MATQRNDRNLDKNQRQFDVYARNMNNNMNATKKNVADNDDMRQMKKSKENFYQNFKSYINNVGKKDKNIDINNVSVSDKSISKTSGIITDDDDTYDATYSVIRSQVDSQREYATKNIMAIRTTGREQTKAMLGGMGAMHEVAMKMHSKYYKANLAISNRILYAMNKSNEFRYTVQANYYKTSLDYKKSMLNELRSIHATLRTGFGINSRGQIAENRVTESMARVMFGDDWKKGLKGGFLGAFNKLTNGAGGFASMMKDLVTGQIDMLMRDGNFLKQIGKFGLNTVLAGTMGKGNAKKAQDFFSNPAAFVEAFFDRLKDSQNEILSALGYGFGTKKDKFGSFSGLDKVRGEDLSKRQIFDKAAHRAITRIIPDSLARIEAKLTGKEALFYDYGANKYVTYEESKKEDMLRKRTKANVKKHFSNIDTNAKNLIDSINNSNRTNKIKELISKLPEEKRNSIVFSIAGVIKGLAMDGEVLSEGTASIRISKNTILKYLPALKTSSSDTAEEKRDKNLELTIINNILQYASNNFVEDFEALMSEANDLKDAIEKDIVANSKRAGESVSYFMDSSQMYKGKSGRRNDLSKLTRKQLEELQRFDVDITNEKYELKKELAKHKIDIKYTESLDYVRYLYEKQTDPIVLSMLKAQVENINTYMEEMLDAGADETHPKYVGFKKMKETLEEQIKKQKANRKETSQEELDDFADKKYNTNKFGGAKFNSLDPKDIKANAEIFLNSDAGDKVSKGVQWGAVAGLSALIARKGGFGKWGAPIAGAMVASAVTARGRLNKMVRIGMTSEGDELMEDGRTKREALMHNLIKDLLPAGLGVATGIKVSNFIKNSVNFGGIIGPVVGFGVGSAIFAISRMGWIKKLAGLFFKPFSMVGKFIDKKFFKGIFSSTFGGIRDMFMTTVGSKLGLDKKRVKYKDILDKPGTGVYKDQDKKDKKKDDDTKPEDVAGSASTKKLSGTSAGVCAPLVMAKLAEFFYGSKVKKDAFNEAAKEYITKHKDGVTMKFFVDTLTESGEFSVQLYKGSHPHIWNVLDGKKYAIIGHRGKIKQVVDAFTKNDSKKRSSSVNWDANNIGRGDSGHFLFYSEPKGKNDVLEYDPLTERSQVVSKIAVALQCDAFLLVKYVGTGGKGSKVNNQALDSFVSVTNANAKALSNNNASKSYMQSENQKRLAGMKANAMNVNIIGGHLDAVGVIGAVDAEAYRNKMKELTIKPLSKELTRRAQYQKDFFQRDSKAKGMLKEQNAQEEREAENTENLKLIAKEAGEDKEDKDKKKKNIFQRLLGILPLIAAGIGPFLLQFLKDGWKKTLGKMAWKVAKPVVKGVGKVGKLAGKGMKWIWNRITGKANSVARDVTKDVAEDMANQGAKTAGEETAEAAAKGAGKEAAEETAEAAAEGAAKSAGKGGIIKSILNSLGKHLDDMATKAEKLPFIGKFLKKGLGKKIIDFIRSKLPSMAKEATKDVTEEAMEKATKEGAEAGVKGASSAVIGAGTVVTLGFAVWDTIQAWRKAHETFGVSPKECTTGMKTSAAIVAGVLGTLELIPFASWIMFPINIFFKKKLVSWVYNAFFAQGDKPKKEGQRNNENVEIDLNGDGTVSDEEKKKVSLAIKKRKEVDERNGHKVAKRLIKQLREKVKGIRKAPLIGKLLKSLEPKLSVDAIVDDICTRIEKYTVNLFVQLGTQGARQKIQNQRGLVGIKNTGIMMIAAPFTGIKAMWDNVKRAHEIMGVKPDEVNNYMRMAVACTYYVLEAGSYFPGMAYIMEPIRDLYGDDICKLVYNNVMIPVMNTMNTINGYLLGLADLNGDGVIDEKDAAVALKRIRQKAEDFVGKVKDALAKAVDTFIKTCDNLAKAWFNPIAGIVKAVSKSVKGGYKAISDFIKDEFGKMAEEAFKGITPEDWKKFNAKPTWAQNMRRMNNTGRGVNIGQVVLDYTKHSLGAKKIFETDKVDVKMYQAIGMTCLILNIVENVLNAEGLNGWIPILQDVMFDMICRKVYNKYFGGDLFNDLEEYDNSGEVKFDKDGNIITNKKDDKAKLNSTIDENKAKQEDSEDVKNKKEQIKNEFKEKVESLFGKAGLSGGWFKGDGSAMEFTQNPNANTTTTDGSTAITTDSSTTDIANSVKDAKTSGNTKTSGGNNQGFAESERKIINKVLGANVSDGVLASIAMYRKEHPDGWKSLWALICKTDAASQKEAKKRLEDASRPYMQKIDKAQGYDERTAKGPGRNRGVFGRSRSGRGSGGKYPFYSQNSFLSTHNVGSETGSEAGCALAVAKMIIKFKNIKMNDMQLYQSARPYITKDNAIDINFFNIIGGTFSDNMMDIKSAISIKGSALALLVNKGYNHFVAIINDNGRLLLGDPENDGWEQIDINNSYLDSFGGASIFSDGYAGVASEVASNYRGKGPGRRLAGRGPEMKNIGFGQNALGNNNSGGNKNLNNVMGSQKSFGTKSSYSGSLYDVQVNPFMNGGAVDQPENTNTSTPGNYGQGQSYGVPMPHGDVVKVVSSEPGRSNTVQYKDGTVEKRTGNVWWRMFNPGSHDAGSAWAVKKFGAIKYDGNRQVTYPSMAAADGALRYMINVDPTTNGEKRINWTGKTIKDFTSTYAPSNENNTAAYEASIRKRVGVSSSTVIKDLSPEQKEKLIWTIYKNEMGAETPQQMVDHFSNGGKYKQSAQTVSQGSGSSAKGPGRNKKNIDKMNNFAKGKMGKGPGRNLTATAAMANGEIVQVKMPSIPKGVVETGPNGQEGNYDYSGVSSALSWGVEDGGGNYQTVAPVQIPTDSAAYQSAAFIVDLAMGKKSEFYVPSRQKPAGKREPGQSGSKCRLYVWEALEHTHPDIPPKSLGLRNGPDVLSHIPYTRISIKSKPQIGDIIRISEGSGIHVCMFVGGLGGNYGGHTMVWCSDFLQKGPAASNNSYSHYQNKGCRGMLFRPSDLVGKVDPGYKKAKASGSGNGSANQTGGEAPQGGNAGTTTGGGKAAVSMTLKNAMSGGWYDSSGKKYDLEKLVADTIASKFPAIGGGRGNVKNENTGAEGNTQGAVGALGLSTSNDAVSGLKQGTAGAPKDSPAYKAAEIAVNSEYGKSTTSSHKCARGVLTHVSRGFGKSYSEVSGNANQFLGTNGITGLSDDGSRKGVLQGLGYEMISVTSTPYPGDILVYSHPVKKNWYGHITMLATNGKWISDFTQPSFYVYNSFKPATSVKYTMWRYTKGNGGPGLGDAVPDIIDGANSNNKKSIAFSSYGTLNASAQSAMKMFSSTPTAKFSSSNLDGSGTLYNNNMYAGVNSQMRNIGLYDRNKPFSNSNKGSLESLIAEQNNLMSKLLEQNNAVINLNKMQLDTQIETAKTNEIISKKDWKSNITNITAGDKAKEATDNFSELSATMERWKNEKIGIDTTNSILSPNMKNIKFKR